MLLPPVRGTIFVAMVIPLTGATTLPEPMTPQDPAGSLVNESYMARSLGLGACDGPISIVPVERPTPRA